MSHFTVAVFTEGYPLYDELADILEPYSEQTENPEFLEFEPYASGEDLLKEYRSKPEYAGRYKNLQEYAEKYHGYVYDPESDSYGYICNPNARWDWWTIGGRWGGMLRLNADAEKASAHIGDSMIPLIMHANCNSNECDSAPLRSIDLDPNTEEYNEAIRFWEIVIEKQPLREGEEAPWTFYKPEYYIEQYGSKENYAMSRSSFSTYAFVDLNGEWHETGRMGWWGISDATKDSRNTYETNLQKTIKEYLQQPDVWITIVDCHI